MKITRYQDKGNYHTGGLCQGRRKTRMDWASGDWVEITRYEYESGAVISAIGTLFPKEHAPWSWGRLHYFATPGTIGF